MITQRLKFLVLATALSLSTAPAVAQVRAETPRAAVLNSAKPAHLGEIQPKDIEVYTQQMRMAIQIKDQPRQDAAVTAARRELARRTQKPLTARTIAEIDGGLDIGGISPRLGATG